MQHALVVVTKSQRLATVDNQSISICWLIDNRFIEFIPSHHDHGKWTLAGTISWNVNIDITSKNEYDILIGNNQDDLGSVAQISNNKPAESVALTWKVSWEIGCILRVVIIVNSNLKVRPSLPCIVAKQTNKLPEIGQESTKWWWYLLCHKAVQIVKCNYIIIMGFFKRYVHK